METKANIAGLLNPVRSGGEAPARTTPRRTERAYGRNMKRVAAADIKPQSKLGQVYRLIRSLGMKTGSVYGNDFHLGALCGLKAATVKWAIRKLDASEIITVKQIAGERLIYLIEGEQSGVGGDL